MDLLQLKENEEGARKRAAHYRKLAKEAEQEAQWYKERVRKECPHEKVDYFNDFDPHKGYKSIKYCKFCGKEF